MAYQTDPDQFFDNLKKKVDNLGQGLASMQAYNVAKRLEGIVDDNDLTIKINQQHSEINLTDTRETADKAKLIDLKEGFRKSKKAKRKENGGWYMVVPLRRVTTRSKSKDAKGMSNRLYNELRNTPIPEGRNSVNIVSDYLYDNRGEGSPTFQAINYDPKSKQITRTRDRARVQRKGSTNYIAFRTVSDKSSPASWLLNRQSATLEKDGELISKIVQELIKQENSALN